MKTNSNTAAPKKNNSTKYNDGEIVVLSGSIQTVKQPFAGNQNGMALYIQVKCAPKKTGLSAGTYGYVAPEDRAMFYSSLNPKLVLWES
jgi:hypothetical protein